MTVETDAGGHHGDPHASGQLFVEGRAEDDIGLGIDLVANAIGGLVDFEQGHVVTAGDVDQHTLSAGHGSIVEQRVGDCRLGGLDSAAFAFGLAGAHHRLTHLGHHRANVGEIEINESGHDHQVRHPADPRIKHIVGHLEGIGESGLLVGHPEQVLVGNNDQGVDILLQLINPRLGDTHAMHALELERLGHHANGEDALLACGAGHHRRTAGTGSAAHAGGDEHHMTAFEMFDNFVDRLLGGGAPDIGLRPGAEPLGDVDAHLDTPFRKGLRQGLGVGVGNHEFDAFEMGCDHVVDGIAARAADADDGNTRLELMRSRHA